MREAIEFHLEALLEYRRTVDADHFARFKAAFLAHSAPIVTAVCSRLIEG